jgi:hypothetical protein
MVAAAANPDPATGLAAVAALRGLVEVLQQLQVDNPGAGLVLAGYRPGAGCVLRIMQHVKLHQPTVDIRIAASQGFEVISLTEREIAKPVGDSWTRCGVSVLRFSPTYSPA